MEPPGRRTAYTPCVGSTSFARPRALTGLEGIVSAADVTTDVTRLQGEEREVRLVLQPVAPVEERR
jgi:hypothetical protein